MRALNYDATVDLGRSPFMVSVQDPSQPPGDADSRKFKDYVPNPEAAPRVMPTGSTRPKYRKPLIRGADYQSFEETSKRDSAEKSHILRLAKEMYRQQAHKRQVYEEAQELVNKATQEQILKPSAALAKALKILRRPRPMSKKELKEAAAKQYYATVDASQ